MLMMMLMVLRMGRGRSRRRSWWKISRRRRRGNALLMDVGGMEMIGLGVAVLLVWVVDSSILIGDDVLEIMMMMMMT